MIFMWGGFGCFLFFQFSLFGFCDWVFFLEYVFMLYLIDIDVIFIEDCCNLFIEWCLFWCEFKSGIFVVVELKFYWVDDLWVFCFDWLEYCFYVDWLVDGCCV